MFDKDSRAKTVMLGQLESKQARALEQMHKAEERKEALEARLRKLESQVREASDKALTKGNDVAILNGLIHTMAEAGAAGYVAEHGVIKEWVLTDGSRKDATVEED